MDWTTVVILVVLILLLALYAFNRNRNVSPDVYQDQNLDKTVGGDLTRRGEYRTVPDPTKGDYTYAEQDQHAEFDRIQQRSAEIHDADNQHTRDSADSTNQ